MPKSVARWDIEILTGTPDVDLLFEMRTKKYAVKSPGTTNAGIDSEINTIGPIRSRDQLYIRHCFRVRVFVVRDECDESSFGVSG